MPALQSIRIQRFKRIQDATFNVADVNVLVGGNNSGKSTIIQALHFGIGLLQTLQLTKNWKATDQDVSATLNVNQLIYCPSDDVYALGQDGRLYEDVDRAIKVSYTLDTGTTFSVTVRKGKNKNVLVSIDNATAAKPLSGLQNPFSIFSPGLAGISKKENYVSDGVLLRTLARGDANLVLRNILLRLSTDTEGWARLISDLVYVFPGLGIQINYTSETDEFIDVSVRSTVTNNRWIPLELSGTGMLQAIQILSYIHRFKPSIVLLDEPDSHLHPNNQRLLCALLRRVTEDQRTQVLLTTHSRHVVDSIGSSSGFLWVRAGKVEVATADDEIGILLEIGALDIKERAANPDTQVVVLTEDEITAPLEGILASSDFNMDKTVVLSYYGVSQVKQLRPLVGIIRNSNPNAAILLHRDRDFLNPTEAQDWKTKVSALRVTPYLTERRDVEGNYIKAEYLSEANPGNSIANMQRLITDACSARKDARIQDYVNGRIDILRRNNQPNNPGQIATEANATVRNELDDCCGKPELKKMKALHQTQTGSNLIVYKPSPMLRVDDLATFAARSFRRPTT